MKKNAMDRRKFLRASAVGALGAGILPKLKFAAAEDKNVDSLPKIKAYRTLGRTGFKVSDISSGYCGDVGLLNAVFDAGVNYVDTAESYRNEHIVGQAIQNRDRKSLFITTKLEINKDISKQGFLERARKCLERLKTDYIDCMMIHSCPNIETMKTEGFHAAMNELKAQGRLRHVGISNHGVSNRAMPKVSMEEVLLAAAEDGRFDVFLLAYNFLNDNNGAKVLKVCKEKNIGTTLMKVNPIAIYLSQKSWVERMRKKGEEVSQEAQASLNRLKARADKAEPFVKKHRLENQSEVRRAAIKWALNNPDVNTVCCAFRNFDHLDVCLPLSGTDFTTLDAQKLDAYNRGCSYSYCRHACGECEPECPENVPVNTIMRYNHYFVANGREKEAMLKYASLTAPKADLCRQCSGKCETACPYGVPIQGLLVLAHDRLTLA